MCLGYVPACVSSKKKYSFEQESGGLKVGPFETLHTVSWNRLVAAAEKCRIDLSTSTKASVYLPDLIDGMNMGPFEITRREFEEAAVAPLVARIEQGIVSPLTNAAQFDKDRETPLEVREVIPKLVPCESFVGNSPAFFFKASLAFLV
jgi:molecular chaperone DnaK (HSP70)